MEYYHGVLISISHVLLQDTANLTGSSHTDQHTVVIFHLKNTFKYHICQIWYQKKLHKILKPRLKHEVSCNENHFEQKLCQMLKGAGNIYYNQVSKSMNRGRSDL